MKPFPLALAPLLAGLACLVACQTSVNPVTGRREIVLMTPADERRIDAEEVPKIEQSEGLVTDPSLVAYVNAVGQSLAAHSPRQDVLYTFQILESDVPNAFALPGGHIFVSRGLLVVANSESELANVLGHEIGHVAARHAAQQDAHVKTLGLSTLLGDLMSGGAEALPATERISGNFVARYARNQEREADRIGQELALETGVDPSGMAHFLQKLENLDKVSHGFGAPQTYLSTHPALEERVAEATTNAQVREWRAELGRDPRADRPPAAIASSTRDVYLDHIEGMVVDRPTSEGVFEGNQFLHPGLNFSLRFPSDWTHVNQSDQVVGLAPTRDGVVLLQIHGEGNDPVAVARKFADAQGLRLMDPTPLRIGDLPAFRAQTQLETSFGRIDAEITWIAFEGRVYGLIGGMQSGGVRKFQGVFRRFAQSFRPLSEEDRAKLTELHLRIARARPGEAIVDLSRRTKNEWDPTYTAIVNGIFVDDRLSGGQRIKIAVREPYHPPASPNPPQGPAVKR
jgi:predicted Zn-dependent protease